MGIKNHDKLIPWEVVRRENFTPEEIKILDARARIRIATRKIREEREKQKITQEVLAEKANIPRTTLSKIESGYQNVSMLKLMQVANAMDMQIKVELVPITEEIHRISA